MLHFFGDFFRFHNLMNIPTGLIELIYVFDLSTQPTQIILDFPNGIRLSQKILVRLYRKCESRADG